MFVFLIFRNYQAQLGDADSVSACQLSSFETPPRSTRYMYLYFVLLHKAIKCVTNYRSKKPINLFVFYHINITVILSSNHFDIKFYNKSAIYYRFSYFKQGRQQRKFRSANPSTITSKYMPTSRSGMTVCADHGWQKKGFDSLTGTDNYCKF